MDMIVGGVPQSSRVNVCSESLGIVQYIHEVNFSLFL